mgnify:CR=1 FL=1
MPSRRVTLVDGGTWGMMLLPLLAGLFWKRASTQGALLAIENRTGRILAMLGGYSFDRSKFNRATQAVRQVGEGDLTPPRPLRARSTGSP